MRDILFVRFIFAAAYAASRPYGLLIPGGVLTGHSTGIPLDPPA